MASTAGGTSLTTSATVSSGTTDDKGTNDSAQATVTVGVAATPVTTTDPGTGDEQTPPAPEAITEPTPTPTVTPEPAETPAPTPAPEISLTPTPAAFPIEPSTGGLPVWSWALVAVSALAAIAALGGFVVGRRRGAS